MSPSTSSGTSRGYRTANARDVDTIDQMAAIARGLDGKALECAGLKAETVHSPLAVWLPLDPS